MAFDFLSQMGTTTGFLLVIIFILFIFSFKKVLGIVKNALIIIAASVIFPIVAGKLLDFPVQADAQTMLSFAFIGLLAYFIFLFAQSVHKGLSLFEKSAKKVPVPKVGGEGKKKEKEEPEPKHKEVQGNVVFKKGKKSQSWERNYVEIDDDHERKKPKKE
jgi:hypothetical protein